MGQSCPQGLCESGMVAKKGRCGTMATHRRKQDKLQFDYIKLEDIDVSLSNVRKSNLEEGIDELATSIAEIGVQQPVEVFEKKDKRYELIIGQRRYLASKKAGETEIPAVITTVADETEWLVKSFSENIHRLDLEYRDKMQVALELRERLNSIRAVAQRLGVSPQTVKNYLGYAGVSEKMKKMVDQKKLSASTALRISRGIADEDLALKVAAKIEEIPRGEQRNLFIDVAMENPREKRIDKLAEIANSAAKMKKITIYVTERMWNAIAEASKEYGSGREEVVKEAVEEWLGKRGFIK